MENLLKDAKLSIKKLITLNKDEKNQALLQMAQAIRENKKSILQANEKDMQKGKKENLSSSLLDRLLLTDSRIEAMAKALEDVAKLDEPIGRILDEFTIEDGLICKKISVPMGVIGIIYESRPNVTSDTAGLCFKSGNACVLKGGKEAYHSNKKIAKILQDILIKNKIPKEAISLFEGDREDVAKLIKMDKFIDLIIPRGGEGLVRFVNEHSTIPVIKHDKGLCHIYIDEFADTNKAIQISINAKCQRTGVCNAMETLLVHEKIAKNILPQLKEAFDKRGTHLKGCAKTREFITIDTAVDEDFDTEYLDNILSIKTVKNIDEAINHIAQYGSCHSEAIITENIAVAEKFLNRVDAACVYHNASTRFTDGGVFGFGAEIGISTNKLHVRGPVGANDLTTYKYKIYGNGQIRA